MSFRKWTQFLCKRSRTNKRFRVNQCTLVRLPCFEGRLYRARQNKRASRRNPRVKRNRSGAQSDAAQYAGCDTIPRKRGSNQSVWRFVNNDAYALMIARLRRRHKCRNHPSRRGTGHRTQPQKRGHRAACIPNDCLYPTDCTSTQLGCEVCGAGEEGSERIEHQRARAGQLSTLFKPAQVKRHRIWLV